MGSGSFVLRPFVEADLPDLLLAFADDDIARRASGALGLPPCTAESRTIND
jgi:hypothetical protein